MATALEEAREVVDSVPPLDDDAFRKFLEDEKNFRMIAELVLGEELPSGEIQDIQGERVLVVNGKTIRMDNFRKTPAGVVNMEAQRAAQAFPFKRHLFYWAVAYTSPLKKGQSYEQLMPAISIVLYEDKGDAGVIEEAGLSGSLLRPGDGQLKMVAVNAVKWRETKNEKLRQYLAILSNGVYNSKTAEKFYGVDTQSVFFKNLNNTVRVAASALKYAEYSEKGDSEMSEAIRVLSVEDFELARRDGVKEGSEDVALKLLAKGYPEPDILEVTGLAQEALDRLKLRLKS